jgi:hypothetical protein
MERAGRIRELMADGYDVVLGGYWQGVCASCVEDGLEAHEMVMAFVRELPMPHVSILVDHPGNPGRLRDWLLELWSDMSHWGLTACMTVSASLPPTLDAVKELIDKNIMITAQKVNSCRFVN